MARVIGELSVAGIKIVLFDQVQANPQKSTIMAGTKTARENNCNFVVALGGGYCTSEHSLEHAMSAYHPELPHGARLIMISLAYYQHFIDAGCSPERFIRMAQALGKTDANTPQDFITALADLQKSCGVDNLKMSDYDFTPDEFDKIADNTRSTMGGLFFADPCELTQKDCVEILKKSYR